VSVARGQVDRHRGSDGVAMTDHAVVIVGAGPTGLMLAGELALADVDVAIVERPASQDLVGSRALVTIVRDVKLYADGGGTGERTH
jgi:thioredoxin reductase